MRLGFEKLVAERGGQVRLLEGYGLTETVTGIMGMPLAESRPGSIGVPLPDTSVAICALGGTEELPPGEEGEICVSGPAVMLGYLDDPEATAAALMVHGDGRTWLHTGDIGRMDEDGFFFFTSRLKRMIKSSGFNVFPSQVETALHEHPGVAEVCVIGVPDAAQGERVVAVVVPADPGAGRRRAGGRADRALPRAPDQVVVPARHRVPGRVAEDAGREDRLHDPRARGRRAALRFLGQDGGLQQVRRRVGEEAGHLLQADLVRDEALPGEGAAGEERKGRADVARACDGTLP